MLHVPRSCCTSALRGQLLLGDYRQWRRRLEVPAATFAVAHPSGCRRLLPYTRSWVTTGLRRNLQSPLNIHVEQGALGVGTAPLCNALTTR